MTLSYSVRPMQADDISRVHQIETDIFPFPWSEGNFRDALESGYDAWVFQNDGQILGYALVMWVLQELHLLNLSIAKPFQRRGLGKDCLGWIVRDGKPRGANTLLLEVRPSNPRAVLLYERFGFTEIGRRKNYYPSWANSTEDAIVMQYHVL
jgi:[ribosomal protein S18]-alanine N-acetyltransferase